MDAPEGVLAFTREGEGERLTCLFNLTGEAQRTRAKGRPLDSGLESTLEGDDLVLPPWGGAVLA